MGRSAFLQDPELDQVFMKDDSIIDKIVEFSGAKKNETVLEIGTGPGNLTEAVAAKCRKLITIELDERMRPALEKKFRRMKNIEIVWGNALDVIGKLRFDRIVANPPYAISEALVKSLFNKKFKCAVLTLPSRFVERLTANPEENYYSKLSLFAQSFFRMETLLRVDKDAWHPRPDTSSMIVKLTPKKPDERDALIREMAMQDDKKLKNALREALINSKGSTKKNAKKELEDIGFPESLLEKKISEMSLREIREVVGKFSEILMKHKLVAFDVDGTLLDELQYVWKLIHIELGVDMDIVKRMTEKYLRGEITYKEWAEHDISLWLEKDVTMDDILGIMGKIKLMKGARETLETLKKKGYRLAVISGGLDIMLWHFIPDADDIFDHIIINKLVFDDEGKVKDVKIPDEFGKGENKALCLKEIAEKEGLRMEECVFVGDSDNDVEVMEAAGLSIGFNPSKKIEKTSDVVIRKKDLMEILKHL